MHTHNYNGTHRVISSDLLPIIAVHYTHAHTCTHTHTHSHTHNTYTQLQRHTQGDLLGSTADHSSTASSMLSMFSASTTGKGSTGMRPTTVSAYAPHSCFVPERLNSLFPCVSVLSLCMCMSVCVRVCVCACFSFLLRISR
jgi:hypothetical protein